MKKFFKNLNRFLFLKEYEIFINQKIEERNNELRYVQDLLLSSKGMGEVLYHDGEINAYINHVEQTRKKEKERIERSFEMLK